VLRASALFFIYALCYKGTDAAGFAYGPAGVMSFVVAKRKDLETIIIPLFSEYTLETGKRFEFV
jgi:hypothetical protein